MPHFGTSWWFFLHVHIFLFLPFYTPKTSIFLLKHGHDFNNKMFEKLVRDGEITRKTRVSFASCVSLNPFAVSGNLWQWMVPKLLKALLCMGSWFETCIFFLWSGHERPFRLEPLWQQNCFLFITSGTLFDYYWTSSPKLSWNASLHEGCYNKQENCSECSQK